jgi:hypothetical protein
MLTVGRYNCHSRDIDICTEGLRNNYQPLKLVLKLPELGVLRKETVMGGYIGC